MPTECRWHAGWTATRYPAAPSPAGSESEPLLSDRSPAVKYILRAVGLSTSLFDHLGLVKTHSYRDAALSDAQPTYPVLVFSHGFWGAPGQNTVQMEELASHGYVVFSVGHPYESMELRFPDGRPVRATEEHMQSFEKRTREPGYGALLRKMMASEDPEERARLLHENSVADQRS